MFVKLAASAVIMVSVAGLIQADTYIQRRHHTDAYTIQGKPVPAVTTLSAVWLGKERARIDLTADSAIIIRPDKNMIYYVVHSQKTYYREQLFYGRELHYTAIEDDGDMTVVEKELPAATMKVTFSGSDGQSRKKIRGWNCRRVTLVYSVDGVVARSVLWVTSEVKIDFAFYNMIMHGYLPKIAGVAGIGKEIEQIRGLPVLIKAATPAAGATVKKSEEIIEITEKEPPPDFYEIPAGFISTGR